MIDLHCHILPALDDGALDLSDSLAMARQAAADGITTICATPHIRHDHDVRVVELADRVDALNAALGAEEISVSVRGGGEVAQSAVSGLAQEELGLVALGGGSWILLEPSPGPLEESLLRSIEELGERGYRALIAHPERHLSADMYERIARLISAGALVQATADFFLREQMAVGMEALAAAGLIHVLASDAHSSRAGRPVALSPAFERLATVEPIASHLRWMREEAPAAILAGAEPELPFGPII